MARGRERFEVLSIVGDDRPVRFAYRRDDRVDDSRVTATLPDRGQSKIRCSGRDRAIDHDRIVKHIEHTMCALRFARVTGEKFGDDDRRDEHSAACIAKGFHEESSGAVIE
jgi:hypothetical protein